MQTRAYFSSTQIPYNFTNMLEKKTENNQRKIGFILRYDAKCVAIGISPTC